MSEFLFYYYIFYVTNVFHLAIYFKREGKRIFNISLHFPVDYIWCMKLSDAMLTFNQSNKSIIQSLYLFMVYYVI